MTYRTNYRPGHCGRLERSPRGLSQTAALAAIRALETAGVLTNETARDARLRAGGVA